MCPRGRFSRGQPEVLTRAAASRPKPSSLPSPTYTVLLPLSLSRFPACPQDTPSSLDERPLERLPVRSPCRPDFLSFALTFQRGARESRRAVLLRLPRRSVGRGTRLLRQTPRLVQVPENCGPAGKRGAPRAHLARGFQWPCL